MKYRITDGGRPGEELILDLDPDEFYDEDEPEVGGSTVTELLDWWSDPAGRGYLQLEDGGYIVVVDASSGEPTIETWSETGDDRWSLAEFPFASINYQETPDE